MPRYVRSYDYFKARRAHRRDERRRQVHPNTLAALRRLRDNQGRCILEIISGPSNLTAFGNAGETPTTDLNTGSVVAQGHNGYSGTLWGASVVSTTHIPENTAWIASIANGGGVFWHRTGLILQFDMGLSGSNFVENLYTWRAEERVSVSVPRPSATLVLTNLFA